MVTTLGDLYLQARDRLLETENGEYAGMAARELVSTLSGRSQEQFLMDRNLEASEEPN